MSCDVATGHFSCKMGVYEFSLSRCDRETVQDVLQFLRDVWKNGVPGSHVALGQGGQKKYVLRRVDDGEVDGSGVGGLLDCSREVASDGCGAGSCFGVRSELGDAAVGSEAVRARGCTGGFGRYDDASLLGAQSVTAGSAGGVGAGRSIRDGWRRTGGTSGVDMNSGQRGPNYERNRRNRENRRKQASVAGSFFSGCDESVVKELRDTRAELLILANKRRIEEEREKLELRKAVKSAGSTYSGSVTGERVVGVSGVVLGTGEAKSLKSVSVGSSASGNSEIREYFSLKNKPASAAEREVLANGVLGISALITARVKVRRVLNAADFLRADFKLPLDRNTQFLLQTMEE